MPLIGGYVRSTTAKRSPHAVDRYVGDRVRMRRKMQGMTQGKLGDALGLTFQQVQKYEKGTNRIGRVACNRLPQFSKSQSLSSSKVHPDRRHLYWRRCRHLPMSPTSMPRRTGSRSRRPTCGSKTLSSGDPLLTWLGRSPEMTNPDKGRGCGSFDWAQLPAIFAPPDWCTRLIATRF